MTLKGKGFFIWQVPVCEGGSPAAICSAAQAAGLSHIIIKIADGTRTFGLDNSGKDSVAPVVEALHASGIAAWGWHYVYGNYPAAEADIATNRVRDLGLDGYVVDAEQEYKQPGKEKSARQFMAQVRAALEVPIALSSYRFPRYHQDLPWATFLELCNYHMPQVYWEAAHNAGAQLRESKRQCDALPNARTFLATGSVYATSRNWTPTTEDVADFLTTAHDLDLDAVNFYSWDYCRPNLPEIWKVIAEYDWPASASEEVPAAQPSNQVQISSSGGQPPIGPPDAFTAQFLDALNSRKSAQMVALYSSTGVHVRESKGTRGKASIQNDFATFFRAVPSGTFDLVKAEVDGDVRYLTLRVGTRSVQMTLVLKAGKIILDTITLV